MMDAYSFDVDKAGLDKNYEAMRNAYRKIFKRCGLEVVPVLADAGAMGGYCFGRVYGAFGGRRRER